MFGNINSIANHHHRMLAALLSRQREQHPLVHTVTDIILDGQFYMQSFFSHSAKVIHQPPFSSVPITKPISRITPSQRHAIEPSSRRTQDTANGYNGVTKTLEYGNETWLPSFRDPSHGSHDCGCCSRQSPNSPTRVIPIRNRCPCS